MNCVSYITPLNHIIYSLNVEFVLITRWSSLKYHPYLYSKSYDNEMLVNDTRETIVL